MRPFADVIPGYPLPPAGMSVIVTRVVTGASADVQAAQNDAAAEVDMTTTDLSIPVVSIFGQQDVSRQTFERGAIVDQLVFNDLLAAYATRLDLQTINGTGASGQHRGILQVASTNTVTLTSTAVTSFLSGLANAIQLVNSNRFAPASVILMHPRRWGWLLTQTDTTNRVLVQTQMPAVSGYNVQGVGLAAAYGPVGQLFGLPVITSANVPLVGASNIDNVVVTRLSDHGLWENGVQTFQFDQAVNPPSTVRLAIGGYSAFTAGRYPTATSVITGTGLIAPTF
jgi:HK97 family phage major capsid protein